MSTPHRGASHRRGALPSAAMFVMVVLFPAALTAQFTRLFLGVHYFSDVVAGYAGGTVWLAVCISGLEVLRRKGSYPSFAQPVPA